MNFKTGLITALICSATLATAGGNLISNGGFETPNPASPYFKNGSFTDWTVTGIGGVWDPVANGAIAPWNGYKFFPLKGYGGNQVAYMNSIGPYGSNVDGSISQTVSATVQDNTDYKMSTLFGWREDTPAGTAGIGTMTLLANGNVVATININENNAPYGGFAAASTAWYSGSAYKGDSLTVEYEATSGYQLDVDNASLIVAPSPAAFLPFGLGGLFLLRRRKSSAKN
jgi:MYXO-CTERM domain-containing protein